MMEFSRFFKKGAISLFCYVGTYERHKNVWTNEWAKKAPDEHNYHKIMVCSTSVRLHTVSFLDFSDFVRQNRPFGLMQRQHWT